MKLKTHVGRTFGAVAIVAGTAAVLFTGSPAHTQFSATATNNVVIKGSTVAESITNGSFDCNGLTPPNNQGEMQNGPSGIDAQPTGGVYPGSSCSENVAIENTGTIPESFDLTINSITGSGAPYVDQLLFSVGNGAPVNGAILTTTTIHLATLPAGATIPQQMPIMIALAANNTAGSQDTQNAWNGASITITYTITATPSDS